MSVRYRHCAAALPAIAVVLAPGAAQASWSGYSTVPGSREAVQNRVALAPDGTVAVGYSGSSVAIKLPSGAWRRWGSIATPGTSTTSIDVAFDRRNRLLAAYVQARPRGSYEIRARSWSARTGWGSPRLLGRSGHFGLAAPRIATNPRGDAIVSWRGFRRAGRHVVEALSSSFRPAGGRFRPERQAAGGGPYRDVALDIRGNAYGVFTTYKGPRNYFVYQPRGRGWSRPELLPGAPASNPSIAVAGDRTAVVGWREARNDSSGDGLAFGPVWALLRTPLGSFALPPTRLSSARAHDVGVAAGPDGAFLLTWADGDVFQPYGAAADLHFSGRGEGNHLTPEHVAVGVKMGPAAYLSTGRPLVVYQAENELRSVLLNPPGPFFDRPERIAAGGLHPQLDVRGPDAVVTFYDRRRMRLKIARRTG